MENAFENNQNLKTVVIGGTRKLTENDIELVSEKFPNQKLICNTSPWPTLQFGNFSASEDSERDSSDSSDDDRMSTGSSGWDSDSSDESRTDLELFQRETNATPTQLVIAVSDGNSIENVKNNFESLMSKRMFMRRKQLFSEIRLAMATAIYNDRLDVLDMLLEQCPEKDLEVALKGPFPLLNFAIKRQNVEACRSLLNHKAPPNPEKAISALGTAVICLMDIFDDDDFDQAARDKFTQIFKLLFEHGADPLFFHPDEKGTNALHYLTYLAGHSPEIAQILLEKTPGVAYTSQENFTGDVETDGPTPIAAVFDMIDPSDELPTVVNVIKHALLPMLRFGAPFRPDDVFATPNMPEIVALDHFFSKKIWGRCRVLVEMIIEARRKSSLNVSRMLKATSPRRRRTLREIALNDEQNNNNRNDVGENGNEEGEEAREQQDGSDNDDSSDDEDDLLFDEVTDEVVGDLMKPFGEYLRSVFPRPLQAMCRTAILEHLPIGPERIDALKKIDLPDALLKYLNFEEFELPVAGPVEIDENNTDKMSTTE